MPKLETVASWLASYLAQEQSRLDAGCALENTWVPAGKSANLGEQGNEMADRKA